MHIYNAVTHIYSLQYTCICCHLWFQLSFKVLQYPVRHRFPMASGHWHISTNNKIFVVKIKLSTSNATQRYATSCLPLNDMPHLTIFRIQWQTLHWGSLWCRTSVTWSIKCVNVLLMFPTSGQMSYWYAIKAVIVRSYLRLPGQPFFFLRAAEAASAIDRLEDIKFIQTQVCVT